MQRIGSFLAILLLLVGLVAGSGHATILFAGGEDLDFTFIGTAGPNSTSGTWRTTYARIANSVNATSGDPPGSLIILPAFGNQTTVWTHAVENHQGVQTTTATSEWMTLYGSDGVRRLMVRGSGNNNQLKISKRTAAGVFTDLVTCTAGSYPIAGNANYKIDWYVNYSTSGHTSLYVNSTLICDYAGDVTTDSVTAVKQEDLATYVSGQTSYWSEIIVATTPTQDMNLFTCAPQANGTNQNWTGTASNVNPTTITDTASITTGTSNSVAEFTCPSLVSGTFTVPAVVQSARTQSGASGPQNFRFIARPATASSDFDNGTDLPGGTTFNNTVNNIWATNPNTSAAWSTSDLGTGVNFGLKSRP